jgi:hypothetical protein
MLTEYEVLREERLPVEETFLRVSVKPDELLRVLEMKELVDPKLLLARVHREMQDFSSEKREEVINASEY